MPDYGPAEPPVPPSRAQVEAVIAGGERPQVPPQPLRVLLVAGPKDHGPGEHDYPAWLEAWSKLLAMAEGVSVRTAEGWPTEDQWESADVAVRGGDRVVRAVVLVVVLALVCKLALDLR